MKADQNINRRGFLKLGMTTGGVVLGLTAIPIHLLAQDAVTESEPLAQAMGYYEDATKVDTAKFPKRSGAEGAKQLCNNCALYAGDTSSASAPCSLFQNRMVEGAGWCNAWVAKA